MLLFAHRGLHAQAPENSLASFDAAMALGVDGIETDVRLSADGLPVIIHDRVTPRRRAIAELTRREIEIDVGHAVPVLDEILEAYGDVIWNIEIKNPEAWPAAAPVLAHYARDRRIIVSSFRHDIVKRCADELALDCALLVAHRPLDVAALIGGCAGNACIKTVVWDYNIVDHEALLAVADSGWQNYVYGAVTPEEHQRCMRLALGGLITDFPQMVLEQRA